MTTQTDEPQEPTADADDIMRYGGIDYGLSYSRARFAYLRDWQDWARAELTAARTRIAEVEGELARFRNAIERASAIDFPDDESRLTWIAVIASELTATTAEGNRLYTESARARATAARLREVLERLQRRGGLGLDVHDRIAAALATTDTDSTGGEGR